MGGHGRKCLFRPMRDGQNGGGYGGNRHYFNVDKS